VEINSLTYLLTYLQVGNFPVYGEAIGENMFNESWGITEHFTLQKGAFVLGEVEPRRGFCPG